MRIVPFSPGIAVGACRGVPGGTTMARDAGFTLIEIVLTMAVAGLLIPIIAGIVWQFQRIPDSTVARLHIQQEMRVATTWIRMDGNKAQSFEAGTGDVYGTFRWLDFSTFPATRHKVAYFWEEGSEVNPAAVAPPFNFGVLYRQPDAEGVAESRVPLIRHVANKSDVAFIISEEEHEVNSSTKRVLTIDMTATIEGGALGTVQASTTLTAELRPEQTEPLEHLYFFLHNNPTPPVGNTNAQTDLPLDLAKPTSTTLFNYDADRDTQPGLQLIRSNNLVDTDATKFQEWVSGPLSGPVTIDGGMTLFIAAAGLNFEIDKNMSLLAAVKDLDPGGGGESTIGDPGSEGFSSEATWSLVTVHFDRVIYTIPTGHKLVLRVQFAEESGAEGMIAYDTSSQLAYLMLPTQP